MLQVCMKKCWLSEILRLCFYEDQNRGLYILYVKSFNIVKDIHSFSLPFFLQPTQSEALVTEFRLHIIIVSAFHWCIFRHCHFIFTQKVFAAWSFLGFVFVVGLSFFDTVSDSILVGKLRKHGLDEWTVRWI